MTRLLARQGAVFIAAGLTQLLVDWGVFSALYALTGVAVAANLSGRAAAAGVGFWLNGRYTFAVDGKPRLAPRNFMRYLVVFVTLTAISTGAIVGIASWVGPFAVYWGKPLVEATLAVLSFLVAKLWVYD